MARARIAKTELARRCQTGLRLIGEARRKAVEDLDRCERDGGWWRKFRRLVTLDFAVDVMVRRDAITLWWVDEERELLGMWSLCDLTRDVFVELDAADFGLLKKWSDSSEEPGGGRGV